MQKAKVSEIFLSYQGEGLYLGSRQLFIRFFNCNLDCVYCDTRMKSYRSFSKETLLSKVMDFEDDYNELVLTGGEPLLYHGFLKDFIPMYRKVRVMPVYLETNGVLFNELDDIVEFVDVIAMDFKFPSSSPGQPELWIEHEEFLARTRGREVIVKAVITDTTSIDDIKKFGRILAESDREVSVVLQPVTIINDMVKSPDKEMVDIFKAYLVKETSKNVAVLGQFHKVLGIR